MATPEQRSASRTGEMRSGRERLENRVQVLIMLLIGGAAGAASFRHVHDVAAAHGQQGWLAWADAVVLELASIAAGLELRRNRRLNKTVTFPATVLATAVLLSLAAQVVEAEASVIGWVAAALPALGFLTMVKIALGRADAATAPLGRDEPGPAPAGAAVPGTREPVPAFASAVPDPTAAVPGLTIAVPALAVRNRPVPDRRNAAGPVRDRGPAINAVVPDRRSAAAAVRDRGPDISGLVPAARTAARALAAEGTPLSRKALTRQLRADGHRLSNATASALVHALRAESTGPAPAGEERT